MLHLERPGCSGLLHPSLLVLPSNFVYVAVEGRLVERPLRRVGLALGVIGRVPPDILNNSG